MKFVDDRGIPVHTVTAEQHALDNPTHVLRVWYERSELQMVCDTCKWWDGQGYSGVQKPEAHRSEYPTPGPDPELERLLEEEEEIERRTQPRHKTVTITFPNPVVKDVLQRRADAFEITLEDLCFAILVSTLQPDHWSRR